MPDTNDYFPHYDKGKLENVRKALVERSSKTLPKKSRNPVKMVKVTKTKSKVPKKAKTKTKTKTKNGVKSAKSNTEKSKGLSKPLKPLKPLKGILKHPKKTSLKK